MTQTEERRKKVSTEIPTFSIERMVTLYHTSKDVVSVLFALKLSQPIYDKRVLGITATAEEVFKILDSYYDVDKNAYDLADDKGFLGRTNVKEVIEVADKLGLSREAVNIGTLSAETVNNLLNPNL